MDTFDVGGSSRGDRLPSPLVRSAQPEELDFSLALAVKESGSFLFVEAGSEAGKVAFSAPVMPGRLVIVEDYADNSGEGLRLSVWDESKGMLEENRMMLSNFAKGSALLNSAIVWIVDRLCVAGAKEETPVTASKGLPHIASFLSEASVSEQEAIDWAVRMAKSRNLGTYTASQHYAIGCAYSGFAVAAMQQVSAGFFDWLKRPKKEKEVQRVMHPSGTPFKEIANRARTMLIVALAHLMKAGELSGNDRARQIHGEGSMKILSAFADMREELSGLISRGRRHNRTDV